MFDPYVTAEVFLAGGLAVTSALLWAQWQARHAAQAETRRARRQAEQARASREKQLTDLRELAQRNVDYWNAAQQETRHLVARRLPSVIEAVVRGRPQAEVSGLEHPLLAGTAFEDCFAAVEDLVRQAAASVREEVGQAARAGVRGMADEAQSFLARLQMEIDRELDQYPEDSAHHQGLAVIDHFTTRALHTLQRLRVLAGSWPGLRRENSPLREIVESARGRIGPYGRVHYTYLPQTGEQHVEGRVVEPVTLALAELLDNATSYSGEQVDVYLRQVPAGVGVVVEDSGVGMNAFQRAQAEQLLQQRTVMDVATLADERKLGFAVIGRMAADYGFRVDVSAPSATGGVKAVLLLPAALLAPPPAPRPMPVTQPAPAPLPEQDAPDSASTRTSMGLPRRHRRGVRQQAPVGVTQEPTADTADLTALTAGLEQMREALRQGYRQTTSEGDHSDD
ncbi:ATP-binding protein [Streptomyces aidingensis]|uniref:histidine kinase n=1 Tax=Streptomyces aidingensis TaxID=910347 RepID=A0A1I1U3E8_9ACTN|nr:ATP-binding protein [Streptomyces aidingensis]SFD65327.1 Signal transduction histidine kinase [Streptomyces aidingensis]